MSRQVTYTGIDYFRVVAALLVVAIHTYPLASLGATADFVLTRGVGRVAVPFFFMASAFFLFAPGADGTPRARKWTRFLVRTAWLYAAAILLYIPLNVYTGTIREWKHWPSALRALLVDGTFYHLWYLPASLVGAAIVGALLTRLRIGCVLALSTGLYAIGLLGDSYYGLAAQAPPLKTFYDALFLFGDYTRNGLFMAPVFFALGALLAKREAARGASGSPPQGRAAVRAPLVPLAVSVALLTAEALVLRRYELPRHDSMYVMLAPSLYFLFQSLLAWKGRAAPALLRPMALHIYIVHPLIIVLVRGLAEALQLEPLLIGNSIVHFAAVAVGSVGASLCYSRLLRAAGPRFGRPAGQAGSADRAWLDISMPHLRHNAQALRGLLPAGCELMAVVKANAYGHGDVEVARQLSRTGVRAFAVATVDEGVGLRKRGVKGEILVLGYSVPERAGDIARYRLTQTVVDGEHAESLNARRQRIRVHIKVDTGMHRLGASGGDAGQIARIYRCGYLQVDGIFTHLSVADSRSPEDEAFTKEQIGKFDRLVDELDALGMKPRKIHIQSSYGVLNYPGLRCDYARIGIALYGVLSVPGAPTKQPAPLRPVLELKARVALVRTVAAGESVGYGRQFVAQRETRIAVLPVGYADGLPKELACGKGEALLHGARVPIIGRICMDQLMLDVTALPEVKPGDIAVLIGGDGTECLTAEQVAAAAGTITNELLSRLGHRLQRVIREA